MPVEYPYGGPIGCEGWGPNSPSGASPDRFTPSLRCGADSSCAPHDERFRLRDSTFQPVTRAGRRPDGSRNSPAHLDRGPVVYCGIVYLIVGVLSSGHVMLVTRGPTTALERRRFTVGM